MPPLSKVVPVVLVKNEEYWLPYALEAVAGEFDRMVIYDVGSEDRTPEIIRWFVDKEKENTDFTVRYLPDCPPTVQGTFRNAMIAEARSDYYWILDGDELIPNPPMVEQCGWALDTEHIIHRREIYGVVRRVEVSPDLTQQYDKRRTHHRLYHRTAIWKGTHPGEEAVIPQTPKTEQDFGDSVTVWHMHNALRSSKEEETHSRMKRKSQRSYHPGKLVPLDLLKEVPLLRKPIEDFAVSPALKELQDAQ